MTYFRINYLFFLGFLFSLFQLPLLYAQEGEQGTVPKIEFRVVPEEAARVTTGNNADATEGSERRDAELDTEEHDAEVSQPPQKEAERLSYAVLARLPHRRSSFTQGLVMDGEILVESSGGYGKSSLARIALASGEVFAEETMPPHLFAEGLTLLEGRLYQLSYRAGVLSVYDADTLVFIDDHQYSGEGWGLTTDGKHLIMSDGSDILRYRSVENFEEVRKLSVTENGRPLKYLNELEWVEGSIYANVWLRNKIVVIDPRSGEVTAYLDLGALLEEVRAAGLAGVLNGIAYDASGKRLYVTGKNWPTLFEIAVEEASSTQ